MQTPTCQTCRWFKADVGLAHRGECRRYPAVPSKLDRWFVLMWTSDWCGEHVVAAGLDRTVEAGRSGVE